MKYPLSSKIVLCVIVSVALGVQICRGNEQDDDDEDSCDAKMADSCFRDVSTNLDCHFNPRATRDCSKKTTEDLCSALGDSLSCSSDFVGDECKKLYGVSKFATFSKWLQALRKVHASLCAGNFAQMNLLINNSRCWSITSFVTCVEQNIGVNHVVDMLAADWDLIGTAMAMASCNAKVTASGKNCTATSGVINEMAHTFFKSFGCGCLSASSASSEINVTPMLLLCAMFIKYTV